MIPSLPLNLAGCREGGVDRASSRRLGWPSTSVQRPPPVQPPPSAAGKEKSLFSSGSGGQRLPDNGGH